MEIKKILWATDFSENSSKALPYVTSLSEQYQTDVHVLYVIEDLAYHDPWYGEFDKTHIEKIHEWERKKANKRLNEICDKYLKGCPLFTKHVAVGDPAKEILRFAKSENVDMIVMATRGRSGDFPFGSVTEKVLKNSTIPVVAVPIADKT